MSVTASWSKGGSRFAALVHGGAGDVPVERRAGQTEGCRTAAYAAREILAAGGSALDAVQRAVEVLEDDPRFNAGTGASLTAEGRIELDAAIMEGARLRAGGVCALGPFKNPIAVARAVLEDAEHVLYAGSGADAFALRAGFERVDESAMITEAARAKLVGALLAGRPTNWPGGTVGAVARDVDGVVAAATSTGGIVGKRAGRVGDSPVFGAGTYADEHGAASATGTGEGILRVALTARAVSAIRAGRSPEEASREAIAYMVERVGATGGLVAIDIRGRLGLARSTTTMSWAAAWDGGEDLGV